MASHHSRDGGGTTAFHPTSPLLRNFVMAAKGAYPAERVSHDERPLWVELNRPTDVGQTTVLSASADKVFHLLGQTHNVRQIEFGEFRP
jgi:hypothetical protein